MGQYTYRGIKIWKNNLGKWQTNLKWGSGTGETFSFPTLKAAKKFISKKEQLYPFIQRQIH